MIPLNYELEPGIYQADYIDITAGNYIKVHSLGSGVWGVDCDMEVLDNSFQNNYWFGSTQNSSSMMYNGLYGSGQLEYNFKTIRYTSSKRVRMRQVFNRYYLQDNRNITTRIAIHINNVVDHSEGDTTADGKEIPDIYSPGPFYVGACKWNNGTIRPYNGNLRVYYFRVHEANGTTYEYIPVRNTTVNSSIGWGLYCIQTGSYFSGSATGQGIAITGYRSWDKQIHKLEFDPGSASSYNPTSIILLQNGVRKYSFHSIYKDSTVVWTKHSLLSFRPEIEDTPDGSNIRLTPNSLAELKAICEAEGISKSTSGIKIGMAIKKCHRYKHNLGCTYQRETIMPGDTGSNASRLGVRF